MVGSSLAIASVVVVVIVLGIVRYSRRKRSGAGALSPAPRAAGTTAATRATVTTGAAFPATVATAGSAGSRCRGRPLIAPGCGRQGFPRLNRTSIGATLPSRTAAATPCASGRLPGRDRRQ